MQFGNPIGFEFRRTVTSGIISAKNRTIKIEEENKCIKKFSFFLKIFENCS